MKLFGACAASLLPSPRPCSGLCTAQCKRCACLFFAAADFRAHDHNQPQNALDDVFQGRRTMNRLRDEFLPFPDWPDCLSILTMLRPPRRTCRRSLNRSCCPSATNATRWSGRWTVCIRNWPSLRKPSTGAASSTATCCFWCGSGTKTPARIWPDCYVPSRCHSDT